MSSPLRRATGARSLLVSCGLLCSVAACAVGADPDLGGVGRLDGGGLDGGTFPADGQADEGALDATSDTTDTAIVDDGDIDAGGDASTGDTGATLDADDTGTSTPDTGITVDSGTPDTGTPDTGTPDTGTPDTGTPDTGTPDTGTPDTGTPDTGTPDTGPGPCGGAVKLLINEVLLQDPTSGSIKSAEFVELYNPNDCTVTLTNFKLQYKRLTSDPSPVLRWDGATASGTIGPRGYYVIASTTFLGARNENFASLYGMDENLGGLALLRGSTIVDQVGWGSPSYVEKVPALAPPMGTSLSRKRSGTTPVDTDDNSKDFTPTLTITPGAQNP